MPVSYSSYIHCEVLIAKTMQKDTNSSGRLQMEFGREFSNVAHILSP